MLFCCYPWEAWSFLKANSGRGVDLGEEGTQWVERGKFVVGMYCMIEEYIFKNLGLYDSWLININTHASWQYISVPENIFYSLQWVLLICTDVLGGNSKYIRICGAGWKQVMPSQLEKSLGLWPIQTHAYIYLLRRLYILMLTYVHCLHKVGTNHQVSIHE